jgi:hypothetical protein
MPAAQNFVKMKEMSGEGATMTRTEQSNGHREYFRGSFIPSHPPDRDPKSGVHERTRNFVGPSLHA